MRAVLAAIVPALLLIAIAVWEIGETVRAPDGVPGDAAWARAAAAVRQSRRVGDLIVFAPRWVDPVGRLHLGDLISLDDAGRMDAARYGVIWELSIRGARAPETRGLEPVWQETFGGVTVRRFEREPAHVVADFVRLVSRARVRGKRVPGPSAELVEVGFEPHRCVLVEPAAGQSVALDFGRVPLGEVLVGHVGLADVFKRRDVRDPGRLEVRVDGRTVADVTFGVDDGWVRFQADTVQGEHPVEVIATAVGPRARERLICFAMEARR